MPTDETPLSFEQPRSAFGTWLGVVLLFSVFALFVWVVMGVMPRGDEYEKKRAQVRTEKLKAANEEYQAALHSYAWIDKEKGTARIPIDRAMALTVADLAQKKPAPAGPIAAPGAPGTPSAPGPQAAAPAVPASAASPAPGSSPTPAFTRPISGPGSEIDGQPTSAANPPDAALGTQPGPSSTPAATPPAPAQQVPAPPGQRGPTPVQSAPGTPLPVRPNQP